MATCENSGSDTTLVSLLVGENATPIRAPVSVLNNSQVLSDWIRCPDSLPLSLSKDGFIYFPACDPDTVHAVLHFLGDCQPGFESLWGDCPLSGNETTTFLLRMYKFATSINADAACTEVMYRLGIRSIGVDEFMQGAVYAEDAGLIDDEVIARWMASWLAINADKVKNSTSAQDWFRLGNPDTWKYATALMLSLVQLQGKLKDVESKLKETEVKVSVQRKSMDKYDKLAGLKDKKQRKYRKRSEGN